MSCVAEILPYKILGLFEAKQNTSYQAFRLKLKSLLTWTHEIDPRGLFPVSILRNLTGC